MRRWRPSVAARLLSTLCAIAALSTGLALALQERSLSGDLRAAARERLARASDATERLVANHLESTLARYQAIAGTPQFRANLEANHAPTLAYYAERLEAQNGAALVLFLGSDGQATGFSGEETLVGVATQPPEEPAALVEHAGSTFTIVRVPFLREQRLLGHLVALESVSEKLLEEWSLLSGAHVSIEPTGTARSEGFSETVQALGYLELRVSTSLRSERDALAHSRRSLLAAGLVALGVAFAASVVLARGLVRPLRTMQRATERIASGDLATRLALDDGDEFGELARAFDGMLDRLEETQTRLARAQRLARLGNWAVDADASEVYCSDELRRIYEIDPERPVTVDVLASRLHPDDRGDFRDAVDACLREGKPFRLDLRLAAQDGSERILHSHGEPRTGADGASYVEGTVQDITERKLVEEQVRYLAHHDSLTGLGNRRLFKERLALALNQGQRENRVVAVMFLDIDDFKVINDTLGHSAGDQLLVEVADRLVACVHDAAKGHPSASSTVARLGGDEFTVLLSDLDGTDEVAPVAERILQALTVPFDVKGHEVVISGSIGITTWPSDGRDVESLLRNSDTAMYHAKREGRNRYQFYAESMKEAIFKRLRLENKLRRAIEREEFQLYYQPKVEIATGRINGVEALVRWRDPEAGVVLPGEFIPFAEETGSILAIGEWVLRTAAAQAAQWQRDGISPIRVSVNLSAHQMEDPALVDVVLGVLEETGLDPSWLELEITETTLMRDTDAAIELLLRLKGLGIHLSLDDFGTGYSSLSMLRKLPVDTLKIDRSFVVRIAHDEDDAALAGAIVSMAKVLRMRVVVEGVENEAQRELLEELGCDEIQGYLYSMPVPSDEIGRMLRDQRYARAKPKKRGRAGRPTAARRGPRERHPVVPRDDGEDG